jgi:hypothetical protein
MLTGLLQHEETPSVWCEVWKLQGTHVSVISALSDNMRMIGLYLCQVKSGYTVLVRKRERRRPRRRSRRRWEDNIEIDLKEIVWTVLAGFM